MLMLDMGESSEAIEKKISFSIRPGAKTGVARSILPVTRE